VSCSNGIAFVSTTDDEVAFGAVEFWFIIAGRRILKKSEIRIFFFKIINNLYPLMISSEETTGF
jgi:hypothetical protein